MKKWKKLLLPAMCVFMMQTPVIYPVGTVSSSAHKDEAKAFEDFLQTDEAKAILEKAGFTINE